MELVQFFKKQLELAQQQHFQITRELNKAVVAVSGGALVLSMTLVKSLFKKPDVLLALFISWVCFSLTIILTMVASLLHRRLIKKKIEGAIHGLLSPPDGEAAGSTQQQDSGDYTALIEWLIFIFLMGGFLMLGLFAGFNLPVDPPS